MPDVKTAANRFVYSGEAFIGEFFMDDHAHGLLIVRTPDGSLLDLDPAEGDYHCRSTYLVHSYDARCALAAAKLGSHAEALPWLRMAVAYATGRGVRFTADEVLGMMQNRDVLRRVAGLMHEMAGCGPKGVPRG